MSPRDVPLRVLDEARFARIRELLLDQRFTEEGLCERLGLESVFDFAPGRHRRSAAPVENGLDALVRLFMDSETVPAATVEAHLGSDGAEFLAEAGLLRAEPGRLGEQVGTVLLYPLHGVWIASDRSSPVEEGGDAASRRLADDAVYPALTGSARTFLSTLPLEPVPSFLELCSGSGVAALMAAAAGVGEAVAVDITARSTAFARFNAALNGLPNVMPLEGDLWAPVAGRTFDAIVAHPPWVPAAAPELIFRDGGEDGEQITRAIVAGVPAHLAPGGVFHCTALLSTRAGEPAAARVRALLGSRSGEFDLLVLRNRSSAPLELFGRDLASPDPDRAARAGARLRLFTDLGVEALYLATIVLRRHGGARAGITLTLDRGEDVGWAHLAWMLRLAEDASDPDAFARSLLDARVRLSPSVRFDLSYRVGREGEEPWVATGGRLRATSPFRSTVESGSADAQMLAGFDGTRTLRAHLDAWIAEGRFPRDADPVAFARSLVPLVLAGMVETELHPIP